MRYCQLIHIEDNYRIHTTQLSYKQQLKFNRIIVVEAISCPFFHRWQTLHNILSEVYNYHPIICWKLLLEVNIYGILRICVFFLKLFMTHNNRPTIASHTLSLSYQVYDSTLIYIVVASFNNGTYNSFSKLSNYECIYRYSFSRQGTNIIHNGVWYYKHSEKFGSASG